MDSADFLASSVVIGVASQGISTVSTTFLVRSAVGADHAGFLVSSVVLEVLLLELALLALPSWEGMLLGWTVLTSWEAVLLWGLPPES